MADNATIVRGIYEAFARGDIAAVLGALHEQAEWNEAEHFTFWTGESVIGPQAVLSQVIARIPQTLDGFSIEVGRIVAAGDVVLVEARYKASATATGKPIDAQVAHVWDLRDGKVIRFQQYTDTWQFAQATGVTPVERVLA
jgi:ketosteroid isomerase-like protein